MKRYMTIAAVGLMAAASAAQAQNCGDTLSVNTTLSANLSCNAFTPFALRIDTPGVILDLNGHRIDHSGRVGVMIVKADGAAVVGPGVIQGSGCFVSDPGDPGAIAIVASDDVTVEGIELTNQGIAVSMLGASRSAIVGNVLREFDIGIVAQDDAYTGRAARDNMIAGNKMIGGARCGELGVWVDGSTTSGTIIHRNSIRNTRDGFYINASENWLQSNTFYGRGGGMSGGSFFGLGVQIVEGQDNHVTGNVFAKTAVGIHIWPGNSATNAGSNYNVVVANRIIASYIGVAVGHLGSQFPANAVENRIGDNQIYSANTGIYFAPGSFDNNGIGNGYNGVTTHVVDLGVGNLWP